MNDLVSIITPSYNSSKFIEQCVSSVFSQTYTNWEMIIVDDFSKDNSRDVILRISDRDARVKAVLLDKNVGPAEARNIAIRKAKGRYIAFLDSDDIWNESKLERQISFMMQNSIAFSFTAYQFISEDGKELLNTIKAPALMTYHSYLKNTIIGCLTVVLDREQVGDFEMPDIRSSHDMALWLIIMRRGFHAYGLDEDLAKYRVVSSSNTADKMQAAREVWHVYRKEEGLNIFYSAICFVGYVFHAVKKRL